MSERETINSGSELIYITPDGARHVALDGDEIPLGSTIVGVSNTVDVSLPSTTTDAGTWTAEFDFRTDDEAGDNDER